MKRQAYTFAEILITLLIISLVTLGSTKVLTSKVKKHEKKLDTGMYACTVIDNENYYYKNSAKDAKVPSISNKGGENGWKKGKCGTGFVMPNTGIMKVVVVGAGGNGGNATSKEYSIPESFKTISNSVYNVEAPGWYDISILGEKGSTSKLNYICGTYTNLYWADVAESGCPIVFLGTTYLDLNDNLDISFENLSPEPSEPDECKKVICDFMPGTNGNDIVILKRSKNFITVRGALAGQYNTYPQNTCSNRFAPASRESLNGSVSIFETMDRNYENKDIEDTAFVEIKWSDKNNTGSQTIVTKTLPGLGGEAGETNSTYYLTLSDELPDIKIGEPSYNNSSSADTYFGSFMAKGGKNNFIINPNKEGQAAYNGTNGQNSIDDNVTYKGGTAGSQNDLNGSDGAGFGSGGGGGAASYSAASAGGIITEEYLGTGGSGGPGLLILRW